MDLDVEQMSVQLQRTDLEHELEEALQKVSMIRDQLAALDVYEEELRRQQERNAGHLMQQDMYAVMQLVEEDDSKDEENDYEDSDTREPEDDIDTPTDSPQPHADEAVAECMVCLTSYPESQTTTMVCQDIWCKSCIVSHFREATINEGVWPPKCCQRQILIESVADILSTEIRESFMEK